MADLYEPDLGTAFYRSRDPVKNFRLRVTLVHASTGQILAQAELEKEADGNVEMSNMQRVQDVGSKDNVEEYMFQWQEKVFSEREMKLYSKEEDCNTVLERKYHQDTAKFRETGRPTRRLFSYVDHDSFTNRDENLRKMTTLPDEKPTILAEKMTNLRHRKTGGRMKDGDMSTVPTVNLVEYKPSEDLRKHNHLISTPVQTMYIMADLSLKGKEPTEEDEYVLCTIRVDANGILSIRPDVNNSKDYRVETSGMGRDVYHYSLKHASYQLTGPEQEKEMKMYKELYNRHTEYLSSLVGHEFEMPPMEALRMLIYGQIYSAVNFEYDQLYIHYFLDLPPHWHSGMGQKLSGITQISSTKVIGRDNVAYFNFPISFELFYKDDPIDETKREPFPKWPMLYLEVLSLDTWERYRTEGYGYLTLPSKPGTVTEEVHCWRPVGRSSVSEMRRFFVGGSPELEDPTYIALPTTFEGKHLSKFGFKTISTGTVTLKLNIMHQSQAFQRTISSKKKTGTIMDRLGASRTQANIYSVIEAFQRAKKRMIAARENLKKEYIETLKVFDDDTDA